MAATCVSCGLWETLTYQDYDSHTLVTTPTTVYRLMTCAFDFYSAGTSPTIATYAPAPTGAAGWNVTHRWASAIPVTGTGTVYRFWGTVEGGWDGYGYNAFAASLGATPAYTEFTRNNVGNLGGKHIRAATNTNFGSSTIHAPDGDTMLLVGDPGVEWLSPRQVRRAESFTRYDAGPVRLGGFPTTFEVH